MKTAPGQLEFEWQEPMPAPEAPRPEGPSAEAGPAVPTKHALKAAVDAFHRDLAQRTGMRLLLRVTDNSSTIMAVKHLPFGRGAKLSLHHMFLSAPPDVLDALAAWVKKPRGKQGAARLNAFIRERRHEIRPAKPRASGVKTQGSHFDLNALFNAINRDHFDGKVEARITWGAMPKGGRRRSIRFGSHSARTNLIRIHPLLDQPFVPEYFLRYIVYHEMLHAFMGIGESDSGRRRIHPPEFKRIEQAYPGYERAIAWMEVPENLHRLLRTRRRT